MMFTKKCTVLFLGFCTMFSATHAGIVERYLQKKHEEKTPLIAEKTIQLAYFKQLIDHNDPAIGTFSQRYYTPHH